MAYTAQVLLAAGTGARNSAAFAINDADLMATVVMYGDAAGDSIQLQISYDNGTNFVDYYKDNVQQQMAYHATNAVSINAVGIFRVVSAGTTGTVGVVLHSPTRMMQF